MNPQSFQTTLIEGKGEGSILPAFPYREIEKYARSLSLSQLVLSKIVAPSPFPHRKVGVFVCLSFNKEKIQIQKKGITIKQNVIVR